MLLVPDECPVEQLASAGTLAPIRIRFRRAGDAGVFYNLHRPHQGIANARPRAPPPEPITDPRHLARLNIHRHDRLSCILREYEHAA
jgi:hypothetical protein